LRKAHTSPWSKNGIRGKPLRLKTMQSFAKQDKNLRRLGLISQTGDKSATELWLLGIEKYQNNSPRKSVSLLSARKSLLASAVQKKRRAHTLMMATTRTETALPKNKKSQSATYGISADIPAYDCNGTRTDIKLNMKDLLKGWQAQMDRQEKLIEHYRNVLYMNKRVYDNLFEKGNIDWGKTFSIDFALLNRAMIETEKVFKLPSERG
jgi:hypothetical protein